MNRVASQQGIALVLVLLALVLLGAIGLGLTLISTVARLSTANYDEALALGNAADAALDLAARELGRSHLDSVLGGLQTSAMTDGPPGLRVLTSELSIDLRLLTNQVTCGRALPCTDAQVQQATLDRPWGANNPRWRLFLHQFLAAPDLPVPAPPVYVVVWIGDDAREDDGDPARDGAGASHEGRYIVRARAEAFGPRGGRRGIDAELMRRCTEDPAGVTCLPSSRMTAWRAVSALVP